MSTPNAFHYSLFVKGIFGRNRKAKFEAFELFETTQNAFHLNDTALQLLVDKKLSEIKPKAGLTWEVCRYPMERDDSQGYKAIHITEGCKVLKGSV